MRVAVCRDACVMAYNTIIMNTCVVFAGAFTLEGMLEGMLMLCVTVILP